MSVTQTKPERPHASFSPDLHIALDLARPRELRRQLERELRLAIREGRLKTGTRLPPTRTLALELGVARSVIAEAYGNLVAEGQLEARRGAGTRVRTPPSARQAPPSAATPAQPRVTARFFSGLPDPASFPRREWQRHHRAILQTLPDSSLIYPEPQGAPELRAALADYLGRVRGVLTTPERMLVCGGFAQALTIICRTLRTRGATRIAVEDPCFNLHRLQITNQGLEPIPIPVDDHGIQTEQLAAQDDLSAVLVSPAHSYPTGAVLSATRRIALVQWAQRHDTLIIEDDYDAEFRYDRNPIGSLQGLAPEHVIYTGSTSKMISPALRLGWLAAPATRIEELLREKFLDDTSRGLFDQLILARFIQNGELTRHLRRVRPRYRQRRDIATKAVNEHLPGAMIRGISAGLHLYIQLPSDISEPELLVEARQRGVLVEGSAWHWADPTNAPPALLLGYAASDESALKVGIATLGQALARQTGQQLLNNRST